MQKSIIYPQRPKQQQENAVCIIARTSSLDAKEDSNSVAPSYQAVSALNHAKWVILTNGRLWRLYSSRVSSASTNYFEIDLDGISDSEDPRLQYFVSLFSASSVIPDEEGELSDLDSIYDEGVRYAREIEDDLRAKIFEGKLFLNLVKAILLHSSRKEYSQSDLDDAKATALRLLYRLLFVLYAESRDLLPVHNSKYRPISLDSIRSELSEYEKRSEEFDVWERLCLLFDSIENGNAEAQVPEYDGELFRSTDGLDKLRLKNKFLIPAIKELCEWKGGGIDYQNLGVRHLGSLYEGLLEYDVKQAKSDLVVYKDRTLDASYAADLKQKPKPFVEKADLYLSSKGLARKGTGSYYTPDEIVKFLTEQGLKPILEERKKRFEEHIKELKATRKRDLELEEATIDDLLGIKVLDPAMGSGHFLVSAVNQITSWVIERLQEHHEAPLTQIIDSEIETILENQRKKGIEIDTKLLTDTIILKRLVMKRCVYGVDLNPLAVELAKLSLWLDSFTIGVPLTYLDNHIRCGDSLIGLKLKDIRQRAPDETLDSWAETLSANRDTLENLVSSPPDLTKKEVEQSRSNYESYRKNCEPQRAVLDMLSAELLDESFSKNLPRNISLVEKSLRENTKPEWWNEVEKAINAARSYRVFHWELEFPEAFLNGEPLFDLLLTNPPWDAIRPYDEDFFSQYYISFRLLSTKMEKEQEKSRLLKDPSIHRAYESYVEQIQGKLLFFKNSGVYEKRGAGGIAFDSWELFLERATGLIKEGGAVSIILPFGIVSNESATRLRTLLLEKKIRGFFEFENSKGIFPAIHRSYKFVLLTFDNIKSRGDFPVAFYLRDVRSLEGNFEGEKFLQMSHDFVELVSPETLSIPEVRRPEDVEICKKIYQIHPLLKEGFSDWTFTIMRELNRTESAKLFERNGKGWPVFEGKNFNQFIPDFETPSFSIIPEEGLRQTSKVREYGSLNKEFHEVPRLVFRAVASSTNVRSMIACILPPHVFTPNNASIVLPKFRGELKFDKNYLAMITYLAAIWNSFVFDYLIRLRVTMNLNFFYVYQTPIPSDYRNKFGTRITQISALLSAVDSRFDDFAKMVGSKVSNLAIHERIELTAELNALVAKHYGLFQEELEVVLYSFEGFKEDDGIRKIEGEIKWNDDLIRKFNGEVRKRVLYYFDKL